MPLWKSNMEDLWGTPLRNKNNKGVILHPYPNIVKSEEYNGLLGMNCPVHNNA